MNFVDEVTVQIKAGNGGNGCSSFHRESHVPKGGPDGGDGGKGGNVVFLVDEQLSTLMDLRFRRHLRAENGRPGLGNNKTGRSGKDTIVRVPPGSMVYDLETGDLLRDLVQPGEEYIVAKGGDGGRGNTRFATSRNRVPHRCDPGYPGVEREVRIELKILADVAVIGYPNVGKSTLIRKVSNATPRVADYPFTTLIPNLGVVAVDNSREFVMADIPGLIDGAAKGEGLGHRFLRHVERCKILLHLVEVEATRNDPLEDYRRINHELHAYSPELSRKKQLVALNKIDLYPDEETILPLKRELENQGHKLFEISGTSGAGIPELLQALYEDIQPEEPPEPEGEWNPLDY